jgi:membrane protease YdiL (CAAX protease family)
MMGGERQDGLAHTRPGATALAVVLALTFPTLAAAAYFFLVVGPGGKATHLQALVYGACKGVQFSFPILFLRWRDRRWPWPSRPSFRGLGPALGFGLFVAALILGLYFGLLRHSSMLARTPERIREPLQAAGLSSPAAYILVAGFFVVAHSLWEEYYWRWFAFGQLKELVPRAAAVVVASLAFMAHHVILLYVFLPGRFLTAALPFSLAIALGGAVWCLLYARTNTVYPPWLSHALADGAIFVVGWDMLSRAGW